MPKLACKRRKLVVAHICARASATSTSWSHQRPRDRNSWSHIDAPTSGTVAKFAGSNTDQCRSFACKMMRKLVVAHICARASAHVVEPSTSARPEQLEPHRCMRRRPTSGTVAKFAGSNTDQCRRPMPKVCKRRKLVVAHICARASAHVVEPSTSARPEQLEPHQCTDAQNNR